MQKDVSSEREEQSPVLRSMKEPSKDQQKWSPHGVHPPSRSCVQNVNALEQLVRGMTGAQPRQVFTHEQIFHNLPLIGETHNTTRGLRQIVGDACA